PSAYLFVITEPCASSTASLTAFSDAISSRLFSRRSVSFSMAAKTSGSLFCRNDMKNLPLLFILLLQSGSELPLDLGDLVDAPLMPSAGERGLQPNAQDFLRHRWLDHAAAEHEHVGVVVLAAHLRAFRLVDERRADARILVCDHRHADAAGA